MTLNTCFMAGTATLDKRMDNHVHWNHEFLDVGNYCKKLRTMETYED